MRTNYHTHTYRCNHAVGDDYQYVESAIKGGFSLLGFSDHTPWSFTEGYKSAMRMRVDELDGYVESIRRLRDRYYEQIDIRIGLECEYFPEHIAWLREQRERLELDYILLGHHFPYKEKKSPYFGSFTRRPADLQLYVESAIEGMESGLFDCMAHPDLFMHSYHYFDEHCQKYIGELCRAACSLNVVLECNYSLDFCPEFWKIAAQENCRVIVGADAHSYSVLENSEKHNATINSLKEIGVTPILYLK